MLWVFRLFLFLCLLGLVSSAQNRFQKPGNVSFAVLLAVHVRNSLDTCAEKLYSHGLGLGYVETIKYAVEQINKSPDILPNVTLGFDVWDYCNSDVLAVRAAQQLVSNNQFNRLVNENGVEESKIGNITAPILAVIGTMGSQSSAYVASLLQVVDIPIISPFATSEQLSQPFFSRFFRTVSPDGQQAKAMVSVIERFGWTYVAIVARDNTYGQYGARALQREAYIRKTFCIAATEYFTDTGYKGEYRSIINKLKLMDNVGVIVFWGDHENARGILVQAKKMAFFGRTFLMSEAMSTVDAEVLVKYAAVLQGAIGVVPHKYRDLKLEDHLKGLTPSKTRGGLQWWEKFWREEFNCSSSGTTNGTQSIPKCNDSLTLSESGLRKVSNGYSSYITDAVYAVAAAIDSLDKCRGTSEGVLSNHGCRPQDVARQLRSISFVGQTGRVSFSEAGNPINARYDFVNFQKHTNGGYRLVEIGEWNASEPEDSYSIDESLIQWNTEGNKVPESVCKKTCAAGYRQVTTTECCWKCFQCPSGSINPLPGFPNCTKCPEEQMSNDERTKCIDRHVDNISWTDSTALLFVSLTVAGLVLTMFVLVVLLKHKDTPVVRGSNLELSMLLLFIISLIFVLTFLHLAEPSDALCHVVQPWRYITCTFCVSLLFLKTNRIVRAFQTVVPLWFKRFVLDRRRQIASVFLLNCIEIILATLWLYFDPPYCKRKIDKVIFITCVPYRTAVGTGLSAIMFTYFIFMSLLCTFYAFKARKLPENYNEARYIGFSMYVFLLSWIAYYPVDSALEGSYITIVDCATALVIAYGVLGCMFIPKVFVILKHPEHNTEEYVKAEVGRFTFASNHS